MEKEVIAILLLAGKGERFHSSLPKQFILMKGKPLFTHAAKTLNDSPLISSIVYVVPAGYIEKTEEILIAQSLTKKHFVIEGGETRQDSAFFALNFLEEKGINEESLVLVQDGDRPNLKESYIDSLIKETLKSGASVLAIPATDSLALIQEGSSIDSYLDRSHIIALQTPQCFRFSLLFEAEKEAKRKRKTYTDEGSLLLGEKGIASTFVEGDKSNFKITEPFDLTVFQNE